MDSGGSPPDTEFEFIRRFGWRAMAVALRWIACRGFCFFKGSHADDHRA